MSCVNRLHYGLVFAGTVLIACDPSIFAAEGDESSELEGKWVIAEMIHRGRAQNFGGLEPKIHFAEGKWYRSDDGENFGSGFTYRVRPNKRPREVDIDFPLGPPVPGIYEFDKGTLRLIYAPKRPRDFDAMSNTEATYYSLKRLDK